MAAPSAPSARNKPPGSPLQRPPPTPLPQVQQPGSPQQRPPPTPLPLTQTSPWQPHQRRVSAIADAAAPSVAATSAVSEGGLVPGEPPRRLEPPRPLELHCEPVSPLTRQSCTALASVAPALKPTSVVLTAVEAPRAVCPCTFATAGIVARHPHTRRLPSASSASPAGRQSRKKYGPWPPCEPTVSVSCRRCYRSPKRTAAAACCCPCDRRSCCGV